MLATRLRVATRQKLRLRVPVFVLFCRVSWIIERGNFLCAGYASTRGYASKIKVKGTSVRIVLSCKLDHRTRQFLMCWLRVKITRFRFLVFFS